MFSMCNYTPCCKRPIRLNKSGSCCFLMTSKKASGRRVAPSFISLMYPSILNTLYSIWASEMTRSNTKTGHVILGNGLVLISFMVMCEQPDFLLVVAAVYSLLAISSISKISTSFFETSHAAASSFHICSETKTHDSISVLFGQPIMLYKYVLFFLRSQNIPNFPSPTLALSLVCQTKQPGQSPHVPFGYRPFSNTVSRVQSHDGVAVRTYCPDYPQFWCLPPGNLT